MSRRASVFVFPGGLLEIEADRGETGDSPGIYLECFGSCDRDEQPQGAVMRYRPTALGYLRTDVSAIGQLWDESRIRQTAALLGFDLAGIVVYDPMTGRPPLARLRAQATRLDAVAVIVPELAHFEGGQVPESILRRFDVITVTPAQTQGA
ncbi:hypothetical protein [Nocardia sp. NPDC020380]|uniref:hypothetical protein n=1 Tax=Nocardia sp. NPDC020380 TaxID=3364309 RepID=UPI00378DF2C4